LRRIYLSIGVSVVRLSTPAHIRRPKMSYQHQSLCASDEIRLLKLSPETSHDAQLCGSLVTYSRSNVPSYDALSYTWGDPAKCFSVETFFGLIGIAASLYSALKRLRLPNKIRFLWIDAICINQEDNKEKSAQVRLIRVVFDKLLLIGLIIIAYRDKRLSIDLIDNNSPPEKIYLRPTFSSAYRTNFLSYHTKYEF
jgi:hypothetical protein